MEVREASAPYLSPQDPDCPHGYKRTEVGVIPEDWALDRVKNLAHITTGSKNTQDRVENGMYPFFVRSQTVERINSYSYDGEAVLTAGDGVGTGKVFHYIKGKFDTHQRVYRITDFSGVDGYYFYLYFSSRFYDRIMQMTAKSSVDSVRMEMIADMPIPLPPTKAEQESIAGALSDTDALIESLEQLIAKKRHIKQGAMQELLTGKRRLPGFSREWVKRMLGDLVDFYKGKGLPKSAIKEDGKFPCVHYGELFTHYPETITEIKSRTNFCEGAFLSVGNDVLMPTSDVTPNGLAKASCIKEDNVILGGDILVIRADEKMLCGTFLSYVIRISEAQVLQLVTGTTVFHLYGSDMAKFMFALPEIDEQKEIVGVLSDIDSEITVLETKLAKLRQLKQGMMHELLTGRIRLVKPDSREKQHVK